jgi:hypothetical protein
MSVPKALASNSRCCASCDRAANNPCRASLLSSEQVVMLSRKARLSTSSHSACHERPPSPTVVAPRPTSNVTGGLDNTSKVPGVSLLAACTGLSRRRLLLRGTTEDKDIAARYNVLNTTNTHILTSAMNERQLPSCTFSPILQRVEQFCITHTITRFLTRAKGALGIMHYHAQDFTAIMPHAYHHARGKGCKCGVGTIGEDVQCGAAMLRCGGTQCCLGCPSFWLLCFLPPCPLTCPSGSGYNEWWIRVRRD